VSDSIKGTVVNSMLTWEGRQAAGLAAAQAGPAQVRAVPSFEAVYRTWYSHVARWVRSRGANDADVEDLTQEVFIIVRRKLERFDGRNLAAFLFRISERTVRDYRRSAWIRNLFRNRAPLPLDLRTPGEIDTLEALQMRERRSALDAILAKMSEKRRTTFVLFEIEGYSGEEISQIQSLPVDTVWTRLHHARKDFMRLVAELPSSRGDG
jgi:RNA polymerase sigma-70 factor (ECF subfamily)